MKTREIWPNLFVPGAGKSGTTSLHFYLQQHPSVFMSRDKEPCYFDNLTGDRKKSDYYLSLFKNGMYHQYRGESSTSYMTSEIAIEGIKSHIHRPKFIFILRNPIDRAYSHYNWLKGLGFEDLSFEEAFLQDKERAFSSTEEVPIGNKSYFQEGCYGRWLTLYIDSFSRDDVHVITSENLKIDPLSTLNTCFEFLSLDKLNFIQKVSQNETKILANSQLYHQIRLLLSKEGDNFLKNLYRRMIPDSARIKLRRVVIESIEAYKSKLAKSKSIPPLTKAQREWVMKYYLEDIEILKEVTKKDFAQWLDFK